MSPFVGIIMGSDSDLPVMQEAAQVLEELLIQHEISIVSAHRTPERMFHYAREASDRGLKVLIAGAGGAAHLPGMVASLTELPVIGVPVKSSNMSGVDSLYSIVQMPPGIPVATMAINGARNAGILAAQILAQFDPNLLERFKKFRLNMKESVYRKSEKLYELGYREYLRETGK
ncbi:MAG: 5-(carboxyamino)imidazole ribonucleotide mutase [Flavobacteriales bacterium]|nr:5-(carboxyamino)imidazole ribonucleotide mutase [Flavobacteriales bacterium]